VLSCVGTTGYGLRKRNLGANHRDQEAVSRLVCFHNDPFEISANGAHRHAPHGTHGGNQLGLRAKCPRRKSSHCSIARKIKIEILDMYTGSTEMFVQSIPALSFSGLPDRVSDPMDMKNLTQAFCGEIVEDFCRPLV
jgi:hypothetical protein